MPLPRGAFPREGSLKIRKHQETGGGKAKKSRTEAGATPLVAEANCLVVALGEKRMGTGAGGFTTKPEDAAACAAVNRD